MLLAVLEKRCGFRLGQKDVFEHHRWFARRRSRIGFSSYCSYLKLQCWWAISGKVCFAAEVGLTGEVRPVTKVEQRIREAEKLGFERIYVSGHHQIEKSHYDIAIVGLKRIEELVRAQFNDLILLPPGIQKICKLS